MYEYVRHCTYTIDLEELSLVVFSEYSTFYHGGATAQAFNREEGWEYFLFVWTEFDRFTSLGIRTNILQIWNKEEKVKFWKDLNLHPSDL